MGDGDSLRLAKKLARAGVAHLNELFGQLNYMKGFTQSRRFMGAVVVIALKHSQVGLWAGPCVTRLGLGCL